MEVLKERFGQIGSQPVHSFTLRNDHGMEVTAINYGCIITKMNVPDRDGEFENIVLGHDTLDEYHKDPYFLGAVVGRVAGRLKGGSFELDGKNFTLAKNDNTSHLHGGLKGFDKVLWDAKVIDDGVLFSYLSRDGEEGYPGNLYIEVTYRLNNDNELSIQYRAQTDQKTLLTVTNHSYFNLSGNMKRDVLNHSLQLKSSRFLELDEEFLPTGSFLDVKDTPFDFTKGGMVKAGAESNHSQNVLVGNGYDHPFILDVNHDHEIVLKDPESGRTLTVETDEPAVVVYSGNSLKAEGDFRGVPSRKHLGICLETQAFPDSIHHPHFPSMVLDKGEMYSSITKYKFGLE
ncbi:aldose epimerase family protein [Mesobacillus selenatarsenatis]|uniref:Aldose 1-epimerase n=1 Tax=Mesobacillus selenatarsenatis (strain DSM 18680 / JCM 14380 / FERM P-15431 / SF-1) TaxID=1321606 RepID=A0A0A8XAG1_MESS1|nr:aldose epimerase family protein [Mesobacillus selenatarsenatis]GAM16274.1 aldose 1-epimerase [Mesobacillus selenatarsenatis SF-1]